ncbi:SOS response-associated peptidase [Usitatibacter palustris]|uniref:Abasic site processing protein n=1 Tax=Usitatibacter palustris TaxID=2732487 RepID=A0A6M4HBI3_9PROT|nr:SOS response-associated peptidase [Usitatibacter palustris]QJR15834.1 SOS response-associated protein YedK [Usitatibacter palustris]
MCSRYFLDDDGNIISYTFRVPVDDRVKRRYNIAPTNVSPVIRAAPEGGRALAMLRWGLVPYWADDLKVGTRAINARSETVEQKPTFREAFKTRRCLVPATGYFEWKGDPGHKQPFAFTLPDRPMFAFAGLWERWKPRDGGDPVETYTILTTEPNAYAATIHDRMPVILAEGDYDRWLSGTVAEVRPLMRPYANEMGARTVSKLVGNPRNDVPEVLLPD